MLLLQVTNDVANNSSSMKEIGEFFMKMGARLFIDMFSMFVLMRFIYYRIYRQSELFFTYFIFINLFKAKYLVIKIKLTFVNIT